MRRVILRTVYTVSTRRPADLEADLPLEVTFPELDARAELAKTEQNGLRLIVDRRVEASELEVVENSGWHRKEPDGTRTPLPRLRIQDDTPVESVLVDDFIGAVSFLTDIPMNLSRPVQEDRFLPETKDDERVLQELGADQPYSETSVRTAIRSFSKPVTSDSVTALLPRRVGLRLYAGAIKLTLDVAQFRELWRVLESAFRQTDADLVGSLAAYVPATEMGFDEDELKDLLVWRGRASHAQSKAGERELVAVEAECGKRLPRLKNLAERVILTKKTWGSPTGAVDELAPLSGYVGPSDEGQDS